MVILVFLSLKIGILEDAEEAKREAELERRRMEKKKRVFEPTSNGGGADKKTKK